MFWWTGSCRSHLERIFCASTESSSITLGGGPRRYIWDKSSLRAVDLIVPGFMAVLMVHLALTRPDGGALSRVHAHVRQYGNILLKTGSGKRERKRLEDLTARAHEYI